MGSAGSLLAMNRRPGARPGPWIAGVAFAGVVAGHSLAYLAALPGGVQRDNYLVQTGHSYWHNALVVALLLEVVGLGVVALRSFRAGVRGMLPIRFGGRQLAIRLALIQVGAFCALEAGERLVSGTGVSGMFAHHLFVLGIAIQLLVAVAGALLLRWLARTAQALGSALRGRQASRAGSGCSLPDGLPVPARRFLCDASRGRAPPVPAGI
jgi:hypothetical protein